MSVFLLSAHSLRVKVQALPALNALKKHNKKRVQMITLCSF